MFRAYLLLLLVFAAQRSFTMRVADAEREENNYTWKTREALRGYLNFLLGGLRRDEQELSAPWTGGSGGLDDDEPIPLFPRHRPANWPASRLFRPRDPEPPIFYRQQPADPFYGASQDIEEVGSIVSRPRLTEKQSNFAVPPSDPRFFQTSLPIQNYGDGDPQYDSDPMVTKRDPDTVTEDSASAVKDLETIRQRQDKPKEDDSDDDDTQDVTAKLMDIKANTEHMLLVAFVAMSCTGVVAGVSLLITCFIKFRRNAKAAADVEYPAYGVTGPNKESTPTGDRRLAHSAQMYHYQLTKQQIIAMESNRGGAGERRGSISEADSDDDNEEGDYTVYECPGLAPTGEMEVKNPLFQDDPTPATTNDAQGEPAGKPADNQTTQSGNE